MKKFIKVIGIICGISFLAYAAYLFYDRFLCAEDDEDLFEDLEDVEFEFDEEEEKPVISIFAQKVKNAAERQLDKVR